MTPARHLIAACATLMLLTFAVGVLMLVRRVREMQARRITPQSVALSAQRNALLQDSRASDNYNHLFELPVLFYALCALALASDHIPVWLPIAAWAFVALRIAHSAIQTGRNTVTHRFAMFVAGFTILALACAGWTWTIFVD
ncbi:MAG: MAPEG family protein [Proteobacteria bacterium]|nr:MAPEG family protein [Pseudomonadota bacterium]